MSREEKQRKFFHYYQNNSGGYLVLDFDKGVSKHIIIEAKNSKHSWDILKKIGESITGFWNYCECCGERWSSLSEDEAESIPYVFDEPVEVAKSMWEGEKVKAFVHYLDNSIKGFDLK